MTPENKKTMHEDLVPVYEERNHRKEIRPFDKGGKPDGNFNYIHEIDATCLIEQAYIKGVERALKVYAKTWLLPWEEVSKLELTI